MKQTTVVFLGALLLIGSLSAMKLDDLSSGGALESFDFRCPEVAESWKGFLFDALNAGPVDMVKALLEFHENFGYECNFPPIIFLRDLHGRTALILAVISGSLEKVKLILDSIDIFTCVGYIEACDFSGLNAVAYADQFKYRDVLAAIQARKELSRVRIMIRRLRESFPALTVRGRIKIKSVTVMSCPELESIPEEREEKDEYDTP
ncbi:MAG: ankyrin repeat domain-containing protein [Candidatus Babeliales bacterium]|jgi:hypothetical protein